MKDGIGFIKQFEPKMLPKHQVSWEIVVRRFYVVSSQTEFAAAEINFIDWSFWIQRNRGAYVFLICWGILSMKIKL
jgi:hypothetical protein